MSKTKLGPDYLSMLASTNNLTFTWNVVGRYRDALRLLQTCSAFSDTSIRSGSSTNAIYVASRGRMTERERGSIIGRVI